MDVLPLTSRSKRGGTEYDYAGPKPVDSNLPDHVKTLAVDVPHATLDSSTRRGLQDFQRAANYIAAGLSPPRDNPFR